MRVCVCVGGSGPTVGGAEPCGATGIRANHSGAVRVEATAADVLHWRTHQRLPRSAAELVTRKITTLASGILSASDTQHTRYSNTLDTGTLRYF